MFTLTQLVAEIRKLAKEFPEAKYRDPGSGCLYNYGSVNKGPETKGCLIGQAAMRLGIDPDEDVMGLPAGAGEFMDQLQAEESMSIHQSEWDLIDWVMNVQQRQDQGMAWMTAVTDVDNLTSV